MSSSSGPMDQVSDLGDQSMGWMSNVEQAPQVRSRPQMPPSPHIWDPAWSGIELHMATSGRLGMQATCGTHSSWSEVGSVCSQSRC